MNGVVKSLAAAQNIFKALLYNLRAYFPSTTSTLSYPVLYTSQAAVSYPISYIIRSYYEVMHMKKVCTEKRYTHCCDVFIAQMLIGGGEEEFR